MTLGRPSEHSTLRHYLNVVRRRKRIILPAVVLLPVIALVLALHQPKLYRASAKVVLNSQNLANTLTGTQATGVQIQPAWVAQTEEEVARSPVVAARTLAALHLHRPVSGFLGHSSVAAALNASVLTFSATDRDPALATRLATEYAGQYIAFQQALNTASIQRARAGVQERIAQLVKSGQAQSALYNELQNSDQQLETMEALQGSTASLIQAASKAAQVQPRPTKDAVIGLLLGTLLGLALAFIRETLDTRVRTADEIGERLGGLSLLARVPAPSKQLRTRQRLALLEDPGGRQAETYRMLRTNLEFSTMDQDVRSIIITSAVEAEGKSTTIANLAITLARGGQRVVLVDLDLRRPIIGDFFDLKGPGITQVALGHVSLDDAIVPVMLTDRHHRSKTDGGAKTNGSNGHATDASVAGVLEVLPAGALPPNPGEFVAKPKLAEVLRQVRERADIVLIDAPPVLDVGDAMTLSTKVDGILVVTRMRIVRRHMLTELARQLATSPTQALGYIVTGAEEDEVYGYGYGYGYRYGGYGYHGRDQREKEKVSEASMPVPGDG